MTRVLGFLLLAALVTAGMESPVLAQKSKDGEDRWVVVENNRSSDMMRIYAARATTDDWEENMLPKPIPAGAKVRILFDDGTGACVFDFRAVFRDNLMVHMWRINVCRESEWRVVD
jgi:hypothetical protein